MVRESICKINLGLNIVNRRKDGYHDIETLMYPVRGLKDIVEILPSNDFSYTSSGLSVDCPVEQNLCVRAFRLMQSRFGLGNVQIHLHKITPTGAGLGGGSANATTVILLCNDIWKLGLTESEMEVLAAEIGSDTPFFVKSVPQIATGRGEILSPCDISLGSKWLLMVKPDFSVSTTEAYSGIIPAKAAIPISEAVQKTTEEWKNILKNDFEPSVFEKIPILGGIKDTMYLQGAIYASMSGSGSTIFGIFEDKPKWESAKNMFIHCEQL